MVTFHLFSLTLLLSLPLPIASRIETAFLQNSPAALRELFVTDGTIPVSLPEPLSLADQLSPDQVFLVFSHIFSIVRTTEFTTDPRLSALPGVPGGILKARWSFRNERTGNQYPFRVYFFIVPTAPSPDKAARGPSTSFRIVEIRAERL
ncbi:MAG: hypothetical protein HGA24_07385 [Candidatus Aminicenantes bacterium]|nr:hypothetical protein [Candidatus Aminicenantes bacterium]